MPSTYTPIATTTLGSAAASYTFSSIPSTYTDLQLVFNGSTSSGDYLLFRVGNGSVDTGNNYSYTWLDSRVASARSANNNIGFAGPLVAVNEQFTTLMSFESYANGSVYKSILSRGNAVGGWVTASVITWRSFSAIDTIQLFFGNGGTLAAGTTLTLYGIKAA